MQLEIKYLEMTDLRKVLILRFKHIKWRSLILYEYLSRWSALFYLGHIAIIVIRHSKECYLLDMRHPRGYIQTQTCHASDARTAWTRHRSSKILFHRSSCGIIKEWIWCPFVCSLWYSLEGKASRFPSTLRKCDILFLLQDA